MGLAVNGRFWSWEEDERVRELWNSAPMWRLMRSIPGRNYPSITSRAHKLGVARRSRIKWPTPDAWVDAVRAASLRTGYPFPAALASGRRGAVHTRWIAFERLNRDHSANGIAKVSGFDHTSVLHGIARVRSFRSQAGRDAG